MELYDFYVTLNEKVVKEVKKLLEADPDTPPIKIKRVLMDKLTRAMNSQKAPPMSETDKRIHITVTRFKPNDYSIRHTLGVNKMMVVTKYIGSDGRIVQHITDEGQLKPKVDI